MRFGSYFISYYKKLNQTDTNGNDGGLQKAKGVHEIEGRKEGEKLNFEVFLTRLSFIKVTTSATHASIYSLGSFLKKLP